MHSLQIAVYCHQGAASQTTSPRAPLACAGLSSCEPLRGAKLYFIKSWCETSILKKRFHCSCYLRLLILWFLTFALLVFEVNATMPCFDLCIASSLWSVLLGSVCTPLCADKSLFKQTQTLTFGMNLVMIKIHNLDAFCFHTLPVSAFILASTRVFKKSIYIIYIRFTKGKNGTVS